MPFEAMQTGSVTFTPARLLGVFALGIWLLDISNRRQRLSISLIRDPISSLVLIFFVLILFSIFRAGIVGATQNLTFNYIAYFLLFILTLYYLREERDVKWFFAVFSGSFALMTVLSAIEHFGLFAFSDLLPIRGDLRLGLTRFVGYMRSPNHYSFIGIFAAAGAIYLINVSKKNAARMRWIAVLGIIITGILSSYSRAGLIGLAVLILVFLLISLQKKRLLPILVAATLVSLSILIFVSNFERKIYDSDYAATRYSVEHAMEDTSMQARSEIFKTVWKIYLNSPLLGVGLGGLSGERTPSGYGASNAHNVFLATAAQFGTLGIVLLALIFYRIFRRHIIFMRRFAAERNDDLQLSNSIYLAMTAAMLVFGMAHDIGVTKWFYLTLALSPVFCRIYRKAVTEQELGEAR